MNEAMTPLVSNTSQQRPAPPSLVGSRPALLTSHESTNNAAAAANTKQGCLRATILSAYDLQVRDPPSYVSITVGNQTVTTGPPLQRHRDRNSFKFSTANNNGNGNSNTVSLTAPLPDLYKTKAIVQLVYIGQPTQTLTAEYPLNQLKMYEKTWLILHLDSQSNDSTVGSSTENEANANDGDDDKVQPTLRLQMTLEGPYRTEIALLVQACSAWFGLMDTIQVNLQLVLDKLPHVPLPDAKFFLIPAAPVLAFTVVSLPIVLGILVLGLPLFLPLLIVVGSIVAAMTVGSLFLYSSTQTGRSQWASLFSPAVHTLLSTKSGQRLVYQTGPRPTPVRVCRALLPTGIWGRLTVSLFVDAMGSATYLLPIVADSLDVVWAPIQTVLLMAMYNDTSPNLKYLSFAEELLPLTDIIPSATMGWLMEFAYPVAMQQLGLADDNGVNVVNDDDKKQKEGSNGTVTLIPERTTV